MEKSYECGVVQDLLPLYKEGLTRPDTRAFVEEHLQTCADCRSRLAELDAEPALPAAAVERAPLAALRRRMLQTRLKAALLAALLAAAVLCSAFGYLTAPQYLTPEQAGIEVRQTEAGAQVVAVGAQAKHSVCRVMTAEPGGAACVLVISCWTTPLERRFAAPNTEHSLGFLPAGHTQDSSVYYCPGDGTEDILLYGPGMPGGDGLITLPRLTLGYYLLAAAVLAVVFGAAWALLRKKPVAPVLGALFWLPACYLIGHLLIKGTKTVSYNLGRDLSLILLAALLLWCAGLLAAALWRSRRQR